MTEQTIKEALARGYCHSTTKKEVLNPLLIEAMTKELCKVDYEPNLGCATTKQLIDELHARLSETELNYRTID